MGNIAEAVLRIKEQIKNGNPYGEKKLKASYKRAMAMASLFFW